jgi:excisionase family DNA binding protein
MNKLFSNATAQDFANPNRRVVLAYTISDARYVSGLGKTKFYEEIAAGRIEAFKVGRRTLVKAKSLLDYLDSQPRLGNPKGDSSGQASQPADKSADTGSATAGEADSP